MYKMATVGEQATLTLNHLFTPSASQTFTFSLFGETQPPIAANEFITLDVPVSTMNTLIAYSSEWSDAPGTSGPSGSQPEPALALLLQTVTGPWLTALTNGLTGSTAGASYAYDPVEDYVTGDNSTNCKTLNYQLQDVVKFAYKDGNGAVVDYLSLIPPEAIESYTTSNVTTESLDTVLGDQIVVRAEGETAAYTGLPAAIQAVFEQAVASGMVTAGQTGTADLSATEVLGQTGATLGLLLGTEQPVYGVQWAEGQSLSVYVQFQIQKTRNYEISSAVAGGNGAAAAGSVSYGGITFAVGSGTETSDAIPVTYELKFRAVADP